MLPTARTLALVFGIPAVVSVSPGADAFTAGVSPPRFELRSASGAVLREVVTVYNAGDVIESYRFRTADWGINDAGSVVIDPPELAPGSCRPWTRIERREVRLAPGTSKRYRFEIHVPANAPDGECRFALLVEPAPPEAPADGVPSPLSLALPITARLAVIVYVVVGDAAPRLEISSVRMATVQGRDVPVLDVTNRGNAHGRPSGFVSAEDARGDSYDLNVVPFPILPGQRANIVLQPDPAQYADAPVTWTLPLRLRGQLETLEGSLPIELSVE